MQPNTSLQPIRVVFTGGGTGGHTYTAFSIMQLCSSLVKTKVRMERSNQSHNDKYNHNMDDELSSLFSVWYFGSAHGLEHTMSNEKNIPFQAITSGKLRRYLSIKNVLDLFRFGFGIIQAWIKLLAIKPTLIISTGGYVSVPVVIAGALLRRPIIIHEQTANVGLANRIAAKFAQTVAVTFEASKSYFPKEKVIVTGNPIRRELLLGDATQGRQIFGFEDPSLPIVYITGGSQGAHVINQTVLSCLKEVTDHAYILHQCGPPLLQRDIEALQKAQQQLPQPNQARYRVVEFINQELPHVFAMADLVVGRSGAGTVNELLTLKKPAVFIPLAISVKGEQYANAKIMAESGAAVIIPEKELTPASLLEVITSIVTDPDMLKQLTQNATNIQRLDANKEMERLLSSALFTQSN